MYENQKIDILLYVEDEKLIREELSEVLEDFCDLLYVAENGAEGLELYKKYHPKIVLTDIKMPLMDGIEMSKEIKAISEDVHIIFMTAFSDATYMQEAISMQATGYILKPIDLDILELKLKKTVAIVKLESELKKKNSMLKEYIKIIDENVLTSSTDLEGVITSVSTAFCTMSGYSKDELIGASHSLVRHADVPSRLYKEMWQSIEDDKMWEGEFQNRRKDGTSYWVTAKVYPTYNEQNKKIGYTAIRQDITNLKRIKELSIRDALTNLYNRRYFNEMFENFIQSAKRKNELVCFAILDIDHFKQYNDTYGHQKGDEALIAVAHFINSMLHRVEDLFFRLGGEEFGLLFKASTREKAILFLGDVIEGVEGLEIEHKGNSASKYVTISAGLAPKFAIDIKTTDSFYKEADDLLYIAKERGRNRVQVCEEEVVW